MKSFITDVFIDAKEANSFLGNTLSRGKPWYEGVREWGVETDRELFETVGEWLIPEIPHQA